MKKLVVVRHGQYGHDDHLNEVGRYWIKHLAKTLGVHLNGGSVLLLTSPADRARESAEIIGAHFGVELEEHDVLWSEGIHPEDFPSALKLVQSRQREVDTLILVTHLEYVRGFPSYFARQELRVEIKCHPIEKGEAWVVDCEQGSLFHVV